MEKKIFNCFIASPSDTDGERNACETVFNEINKSIGNNFNFRIESPDLARECRQDQCAEFS